MPCGSDARTRAIRARVNAWAARVLADEAPPVGAPRGWRRRWDELVRELRRRGGAGAKGMRAGGGAEGTAT